SPSEDQTEADVGPEGSQDEDNQFGPTEEPTSILIATIL
ncbi:hypothetical protein Tco_0049646, partial [Tanacetum coccineum]